MAARSSCAKTAFASTGWTTSTPSMASDGVAEALGHRVGVPRVVEPEVLGEEGLELRGAEAHLGVELEELLADELGVGGELGAQDHHRLAEHEAVLGAAEGEEVDSCLGRDRGEGEVEGRGGVRDTGSVDVEEEVHRVRALGDGGDLVQGVDRAELGGLGDGDDAGLG